LPAEDLFSLVAVRIRRFIPYDSLAIYMIQDELLIPEFVTGQDFALFSSLRIPLGEGLAGWVAQNSKEILNGNPSVEPGYLNDPSKDSSLRSALAVPLCAQSVAVGVLALYRAKPGAFMREELELIRMLASSLDWALQAYSRQCKSKPPVPPTQASQAAAGA
jgi:putative methionine-R-sulfoxide reductase with GAF domain